MPPTKTDAAARIEREETLTFAASDYLAALQLHRNATTPTRRVSTQEALRGEHDRLAALMQENEIVPMPGLIIRRNAAGELVLLEAKADRTMKTKVRQPKAAKA